MNERKRYPSDLTDERWALIEPVITAWKAVHRSVSGHQGGYEMREIVNAIWYQSRTRCQWDYLPPRSVACYYFARWRDLRPLCEPVTCAWPWTCRSCPRTPRTSGQS